MKKQSIFKLSLFSFSWKIVLGLIGYYGLLHLGESEYNNLFVVPDIVWGIFFYGILLFVSYYEAKKYNSIKSIVGEGRIKKDIFSYGVGLTILWTAIVHLAFVALLPILEQFNPMLLMGLLNSNERVIEYIVDPQMFIYGVVFASIVEEIVFRGVLLNWALEKTTQFKAVVGTSLLFSILHVWYSSFSLGESLWMYITAFFMSVIVSYVYIKTRRLIVPIVIHGLGNFLGRLFPLILNYALPSNVNVRIMTQGLDGIRGFIVGSSILVALLSIILIYILRNMHKEVCGKESPYRRNHLH